MRIRRPRSPSWRRSPGTATTRTLWLTVLLSVVFESCHGFSSTVSSSLPTIPLQNIQQSQLAVLDGAEWASIQCLQPSSSTGSNYGYMNVVVGENDQGNTVMGMQCSKNKDCIYKDSVAVIPSGCSVEDALATYIASVSTVHAVLPQSENVGGSDTSIIGGKVVVLGSNELACFAAQGLASLGVSVCLVSTGNPKVESSPKFSGSSK